MSKYKIWDKKSNVIVPTGKVFTPEQWIAKYPMAGVEGIKLIIGGGAINGSVCMEFTETIATFKKMGCDFSNCQKDQDYLDKIEQFEDKESQEGSNFVSTDERIAAALEAQLMLSIPDEEEGE